MIHWGSVQPLEDGPVRVRATRLLHQEARLHIVRRGEVALAGQQVVLPAVRRVDLAVLEPVHHLRGRVMLAHGAGQENRYVHAIPDRTRVDDNLLREPGAERHDAKLQTDTRCFILSTVMATVKA